MRTKPEKIYYYRGLIETGLHYKWTNGYSANSDKDEIIYPWSTKRECQKEAKNEGFKAVFKELK